MNKLSVFGRKLRFRTSRDDLSLQGLFFTLTKGFYFLNTKKNKQGESLSEPVLFRPSSMFKHIHIRSLATKISYYTTHQIRSATDSHIFEQFLSNETDERVYVEIK